MASLAEAQECDLRHYKFKNFHGFILKDAKRLQRKTDHWFLEKEKSDSIIVRHRELIHTLEVPLNCLTKALRRFSYVDTIDVTENSDYLIQNWFDKIPEMARYTLSSKEISALNSEIINSWKNKFERKKAHLLLARRLYLSSPGTCLIAFYSDNPTIGIDLWSLKGISKEDAKILALWLNSSINILQLLYMGVACEGPWMKLHDYMLDRLLVPDPKALTPKEKAELLRVFNNTKEIIFRSFMEQFKTRDKNRKTIDRAWLQVLGYKGDVDQFLDRLYSSLADEIELLKSLMAEKEVQEETAEEE